MVNATNIRQKNTAENVIMVKPRKHGRRGKHVKNVSKVSALILATNQ